MTKRVVPRCAMECVSAKDSDTGHDELFIVLAGRRIAKRGYPDTPQARTWIPLEPGFAVYDGPDSSETGEGSIVVEQNGARIQ